MKPMGMALLIPGLIALIPFKVVYLEEWDMPFFIIATLGLLISFRTTQKIGWRLNLEGNILYYSKFNLYSSWKKRRSQEFALSCEKLTRIEFEGSNFTIFYHPLKKLRFNTRGLNSISYERLEKLKIELDTQIRTKNA